MSNNRVVFLLVCVMTAVSGTGYAEQFFWERFYQPENVHLTPQNLPAEGTWTVDEGEQEYVVVPSSSEPIVSLITSATDWQADGLPAYTNRSIFVDMKVERDDQTALIIFGYTTDENGDQYFQFAGIRNGNWSIGNYSAGTWHQCDSYLASWEGIEGQLRLDIQGNIARLYVLNALNGELLPRLQFAFDSIPVNGGIGLAAADETGGGQIVFDELKVESRVSEMPDRPAFPFEESYTAPESMLSLSTDGSGWSVGNGVLSFLNSQDGVINRAVYESLSGNNWFIESDVKLLSGGQSVPRAGVLMGARGCSGHMVAMIQPDGCFIAFAGANSFFWESPEYFVSRNFDVDRAYHLSVRAEAGGVSLYIDDEVAPAVVFNHASFLGKAPSVSDGYVGMIASGANVEFDNFGVSPLPWTSAADDLDITALELVDDSIIDKLIGQYESSPERLYEYVTNEIKFNWNYRDSKNGGAGTLWRGYGSGLDQCSALMALLRRVGVPCRYTRGTVTMKATDWIRLYGYPMKDSSGETVSGDMPFTLQDMWWVQANVGGKVVELFPWIKFYETLNSGKHSLSDILRAPDVNHPDAIGDWAVDPNEILGAEFLRRYFNNDPDLFPLDENGKLIWGSDQPMNILGSLVRKKLEDGHIAQSYDQIGVRRRIVPQYINSLEEARPDEIIHAVPYTISDGWVDEEACIYSNLDDVRGRMPGDYPDERWQKHGISVYGYADGLTLRKKINMKLNRADGTTGLEHEFYACDLVNKRVVLKYEPVGVAFDAITGSTEATPILMLDGVQIGAWGGARPTYLDGNGYHNNIEIVWEEFDWALADYKLIKSRDIRVGNVEALALILGNVSDQMLDYHLSKYDQIIISRGGVSMPIEPADPEYENVYGNLLWSLIMRFCNHDYHHKVEVANLMHAFQFPYQRGGRVYHEIAKQGDSFFMDTMRIDLLFNSYSKAMLRPEQDFLPYEASRSINAFNMAIGSAYEHGLFWDAYGAKDTGSTMKFIREVVRVGGECREITPANLIQNQAYINAAELSYSSQQSIYANVETFFSIHPGGILWMPSASAELGSIKGLGYMLLSSLGLNAEGDIDWGNPDDLPAGALIRSRSLDVDGGGIGAAPVNTISTVAGFIDIDVTESAYDDQTFFSGSPLAVDVSSIFSSAGELDIGDINLFNDDQIMIDVSAGAYGDAVYTDSEIVAKIGKSGFSDLAIGRFFSESGSAIFDPVNAISGEFYEDDIDFRLTAPEPLVVTRSYISSSVVQTDVGASWRINHDYYLFVNNVLKNLAQGVALSDDAEVRLGEDDGTVLLYSRTSSTEPNKLYINENPAATDENERLNNYNSNGIGARSNIKNNWVEYNPVDRSFVVHTSAGATRKFEWREFGVSGDEGYRQRPYLSYEQSTAGNKVIYSYTDDGLPAELKASDSSETIVFNWIKFEYDSHKRIVALIPSDGRRVRYTYDKFNDLVKVVRADHTEVVYEYERIQDDEGLFVGSTHDLIRIEKPEGRVLENDYYRKGDIVRGKTLLSDDYRVGRVSLQRATVAGHYQPVANARFLYNENTDPQSPDYGSGFTEVYDVFGNKQVYRFDSDKRLTAIEKYEKDDTVALGSITVNLFPEQLHSQGAQWKLTSGPDTSWHSSGEMVYGIPINGSPYTIIFSDVAGAVKPTDITDANITALAETTLSANYLMGDVSLLPGGDFWMGIYDGVGGSLVNLSPFYIDVTEVSIADYQAFCAATGRQMPSEPSFGWADTTLPIVNVTWYDATAYAEWVGKQLPTEAQYEFAMRSGYHDKRYTFGDDITTAQAHYDDTVSGSPSAVYSYAATPNYALRNIAGNVWEWCNDWYDSDYEPTFVDPPGPDYDTGLKSKRGGAWISFQSNLRCVRRYSGSPDAIYKDLGFRCASMSAGSLSSPQGNTVDVWQDNWPIMDVDNYSYSLANVEQRYWDGEGNLVSKVIKDGNGVVLSVWTALYDDRGNLLSETTIGDLSGTFTAALLVDANGLPVNGETATTSYTYTYHLVDNPGDTLNLRTSKTEPNGRVTRYEYDLATGKIAASFVCKPDETPSDPFDNEITVRGFYDYNSQAVLLSTVTDDGSSEDKTDLTSVSQRTIKYLVPGQSLPLFGLAETAREKYYDFNLSSEVLLNKSEMDYDNRGNVSNLKAFDSDNNLLTENHMVYDSGNKIVESTDSLGNVSTYKYDANGNHVETDGPRTDLSDIVTKGYDFFNTQTSVTTSDGLGHDLVSESAYDAFGDKLSDTDIFGNVTHYEYDSLYRLTKIIQPSFVDAEENTVTPEIVNEYDSFDRLAAQTDPNGNVTRYKYNSRNQQTEITYADLGVERMEYNIDGLLQKNININGTYSLHEFDYLKRLTKTVLYSSEGQVLAETSTGYNDLQKTSEIDANGNVIVYDYDDVGRVLSIVGPVVDAGSSKVVYLYDDLSRAVGVKKYYGADENIDYWVEVVDLDPLGQPLEKRVETSSGGVQSKVSYQYDPAGNVIVETTYPEAAAAGVNTAYEYDALNQVTKITDALGNRLWSQYDYGYEGLYRYTFGDDRANTKQWRDSHGRVRRTQADQAAGAEFRHVTEFKYDAAGNKTRRIDNVHVLLDEDHSVVSAWAYDSRNRIVKQTDALSDPEEKSRHFFYNAFGELSYERTPNRVDLSYEYDERGRATNLKSSDGTISYTYTYDDNNNILKVDDSVSSSSTTRGYDSSNRLTAEEQASSLNVQYAYDRGGRVSRALFDGTHAVDYDYNASQLSGVKRVDAASLSEPGVDVYQHLYADRGLDGLLSLSTMANGQSLAFPRDELSRVTSIVTPDWNMSVSAVNGYDRAGVLYDYSSVDPLGQTDFTHSYDGGHRLISESGVETHSYTYDSVGNILTEDSGALTYDYNSLNQLTRMDADVDVATGNIRVPVAGLSGPTISGKKVVSVTVSVDAGAPLNATLNVSGRSWKYIDTQTQQEGVEIPIDGVAHTIDVVATAEDSSSITRQVTVTYDPKTETSFIYDNNGNMLQRAEHGNSLTVTSYKYDALDRLLSVEKNDAGTPVFKELYQYDSFNRRIRKRSYDWLSDNWQLSTDKYFLYSGQNEVGSVDVASGQIVEFRVLGEGKGAEIGAAVAIEIGSNVYVPIHDHRGNVILLLNKADGSVAEYYRYTAYGKEKIYDGSNVELQSSGIGNPWRFSSKRKDVKTGLIYFGRRYYSPALKRWITQDPAGYADGPSMYVYVRGNPVSRIDQDGRLSKNSISYNGFTQGNDRGWSADIELSDSIEQTLRFEIGIGGTAGYGLFAHGEVMLGVELSKSDIARVYVRTQEALLAGAGAALHGGGQFGGGTASVPLETGHQSSYTLHIEGALVYEGGGGASVDLYDMDNIGDVLTREFWMTDEVDVSGAVAVKLSVGVAAYGAGGVARNDIFALPAVAEALSIYGEFMLDAGVGP